MQELQKNPEEEYDQILERKLTLQIYKPNYCTWF